MPVCYGPKEWTTVPTPSVKHVSVETLCAASPMLGHQLEDRTCIQQAQDLDLFATLSDSTATPLSLAEQRGLFCVAPLDILVSSENGRKSFHLLELNGTGIGGITNMPELAIGSVLSSLRECTQFHGPETGMEADGVYLLAISGKESQDSPRKNRLLHEKLLFVEALREGLTARFGRCGAANLEQLQAAPVGIPRREPTVVFGYIKDFLKSLNVTRDGRLWLEGRPVIGLLNDRFCQNIVQRFGTQVDLERLQILNRTYEAGSDKGTAYGLLDEFVQNNPVDYLPNRVLHTHAHTRRELIDTVLRWRQLGRQVVIKPMGTGLGHGIEFFLTDKEPREQMIERIDQSLQLTEEFYGITGGALPYTVCEFVDAHRVADPRHPLFRHKYELRVVVYRDGDLLRAVPSIAKIARECDLGGGSPRRALINNITASGDTTKICGTDYMLPLCTHETLQILDLSENDLFNLCTFATGYVGHVVNSLTTANLPFTYRSAS